MSHFITQSCCNDAACVDACPVNCIHPAPGEPGYMTAEMLHIDAAVCIDCGACADVCPVGAISSDDELAPRQIPYIEINAHYYRAHGARSYRPVRAPTAVAAVNSSGNTGPLRVAIVGSGPAAAYAAEELLAQEGLAVEVHVYERLPTPWGLARLGVAPDHPQTKDVIQVFERTARRPGFSFHLNIDVGRDVSHDDLARSHHAVLYGVGASRDRPLGIAGEQLPGSHSAAEFVAWYNGHPEQAGQRFPMESSRAVIIGNGNVALDLARVLLSDVDELARTDIADAALEQLAASRIEEVVVIGRRGPAEAGFTLPELIGLADRGGFDVEVRAQDVGAAALAQARSSYGEHSLKYHKVRRLAALAGTARTRHRRVSLRFLCAPVEMLGAEAVQAVRFVRNELVDDGAGRKTARPTGEYEEIACGLVLRAAGFRGQPIAGLPFDDRDGIFPNVAGRVIDPRTGLSMRGAYVVGWAKRGPSGVIGANKWCARETVSALLADHAEGRLATPRCDAIAELSERLGAGFALPGWSAIDAYERAAGRMASRPRVKVTDHAVLLEIARRERRA